MTIEPNLDPVQSLYDETYYRCHCGHIPYERSDFWLRFFHSIADQIVRALRPRRVLDAGCAKGFLVEALWERGVQAYKKRVWGDESSIELQIRSKSAVCERV